MNLVDHLQKRYLNFDLHSPLLDESNGVVTFYLWNLSGQLVGYQQYRPGASKEKRNHPREGRYYTFRANSTVAVWGVESLYLTPNLVFVTEGVFDAARLTALGASALAVLSNDPTTDVKNFLHCLGRQVVVVCDNDVAGRRLAKLSNQVVFTDSKDLGDSSDEFVKNLVNQFVR